MHEYAPTTTGKRDIPAPTGREQPDQIVRREQDRAALTDDHRDGLHHSRESPARPACDDRWRAQRWLVRVWARPGPSAAPISALVLAWRPVPDDRAERCWMVGAADSAGPGRRRWWNSVVSVSSDPDLEELRRVADRLRAEGIDGTVDAADPGRLAAPDPDREDVDNRRLITLQRWVNRVLTALDDAAAARPPH